MIYKRGYLEISFGWLFALIVGAFILFLAIFASTKIIKTGEIEIDAKTAKQIGVLTNPLETGFESAKSVSMTLPVEARIYARCREDSKFGKQLVQVSQKSFGKWTETDVDVSFANKYIFGENYAEGKKFFIFSKPFEFPFKVADLIYITSSNKKYCFFEAPEEIADEISGISQENLAVENCSENSVKICFQRSDCEINVYKTQGYVEKNSNKLYFEGDALMYAAIFSEKTNYECEVKRLMQRVNSLAKIYKDKGDFISRAGCSSSLNNELEMLISATENFSGAENLALIIADVQDLGEKNEENSQCKLW